jgi:peptidyl-prolyl cis-trans isomerase A (cyclophilin A)/peptidyl-prolyl cis-trans isomerase B (cyclophilin B)
MSPALLKPVLLILSLLSFSLHSVAAEQPADTTASNPRVVINTNQGTIEVELYPQQAPKTVANFLAYVKQDFYSGTVFHRVIKNFMIQGGGFTTELERKDTLAPVENEAYNGLPNKRGSIAMARTNQPHSATSQFFINTADNKFLNFSSKSMRGWGYTVFGQVTQGMDVVGRIENSRTGAGGVFSQDVPLDRVIIHSIQIKQP